MIAKHLRKMVVQAFDDAVALAKLGDGASYDDLLTHFGFRSNRTRPGTPYHALKDELRAWLRNARDRDDSPRVQYAVVRVVSWFNKKDGGPKDGSSSKVPVRQLTTTQIEGLFSVVMGKRSKGCRSRASRGRRSKKVRKSPAGGSPAATALMKCLRDGQQQKLQAYLCSLDASGAEDRDKKGHAPSQHSALPQTPPGSPPGSPVAPAVVPTAAAAQRAQAHAQTRLQPALSSGRAPALHLPAEAVAAAGALGTNSTSSSDGGSDSNTEAGRDGGLHWGTAKIRRRRQKPASGYFTRSVPIGPFPTAALRDLAVSLASKQQGMEDPTREMGFADGKGVFGCPSCQRLFFLEQSRNGHTGKCRPTKSGDATGKVAAKRRQGAADASPGEDGEPGLPVRPLRVLPAPPAPARNLISSFMHSFIRRGGRLPFVAVPCGGALGSADSKAGTDQE